MQVAPGRHKLLNNLQVELRSQRETNEQAAKYILNLCERKSHLLDEARRMVVREADKRLYETSRQIHQLQSHQNQLLSQRKVYADNMDRVTRLIGQMRIGSNQFTSDQHKLQVDYESVRNSLTEQKQDRHDMLAFTERCKQKTEQSKIRVDQLRAQMDAEHQRRRRNHDDMRRMTTMHQALQHRYQVQQEKVISLQEQVRSYRLRVNEARTLRDKLTRNLQLRRQQLNRLAVQTAHLKRAAANRSLRGPTKEL